MLNADKPYLKNLMLNYKKDIVYNAEKFQHEKEGVNTCGRFVVARLLLSDLDTNQFKEIFKGKYSDDKVTNFTDNLKKI